MGFSEPQTYQTSCPEKSLLLDIQSQVFQAYKVQLSLKKCSTDDFIISLLTWI